VRIWHGCSLNKPTVLSTGEWMINVSLWNRERIAVPFKESFPELDVYRMANQLVSIDEGETWTRRGGVRFPKPAFDEAHIVERRDGSLWITSRSDEGLYESVSTDRGRTWSEPCKSSIGHLPSRHHLRRLKSGRLLLVKHGLTVDEVITVRSHLCAFLSEDEGRTWKGGLLIDVREHVSYPDGFQSADGSICIIYDFHRGLHGDILFARFREEDILAGNWVTADSVRMRFIATGFPPAIARRRQIEGSEA
jgi:hypothetical protein